MCYGKGEDIFSQGEWPWVIGLSLSQPAKASSQIIQTTNKTELLSLDMLLNFSETYSNIVPAYKIFSSATGRTELAQKVKWLKIDGLESATWQTLLPIRPTKMKWLKVKFMIMQ